MEPNCMDENLRMRGMNLNHWIVRMLEETISLGMAYINMLM